jgi:phytanoyl-CoA hydroxylase
VILRSRRYFLEEGAVDKDGKLTREKSKAVNKIGHGKPRAPSSIVNFKLGSFPHHVLGLHILDPVFRKVTLENEQLKALVRDLKFHHDPVGECGLL